MTAVNGSHNSPPQVSTGTGPPRWSAVQAAREAGVSRSTIHQALKSGRLQATKDDDGAWQITPQALIEAGFRPGAPTKVHQPTTVDTDDDSATVPADVHRLTVELVKAQTDARVLEVERDTERRLREIVEAERDRLRRQIEAAPPQAPLVAPVAPPPSDPIPTHAPAPGRPSAGKWRRAWNIVRHG